MLEDLVHILYLTLQLFPQFAINGLRNVSNLVYDSKVHKDIESSVSIF